MNEPETEKHIPDFSTAGMRPKIRVSDGFNWLRVNTGVYENNGNAFNVGARWPKEAADAEQGHT